MSGACFSLLVILLIFVSSLEAHHEDGMKNFTDSSDYGMSLERRYGEYANEVIPESKSTLPSMSFTPTELGLESKQTQTVATYEISRGMKGIPVFPDINYKRDGPEVVRKVLEGCFSYIWGWLRSSCYAQV